MKYDEQIREIKAVYIQKKRNKGVVPGVSIMIDYFPPPIAGTELIFTVNELKKMVKECEKIL